MKLPDPRFSCTWFQLLLLAWGMSLLTSCSSDADENPDSTKALSDLKFWAYQIDSLSDPASIDALVESHYDLIVMDQVRSLRGAEDHDSKADVARIRNSSNSGGGKKLVLCYLDAGQAEAYRYYWNPGWSSGSPPWILGADPDGWNDNYGVQYWSEEWKSILNDYLLRIIEDGYDGVYLDWLMICDDPEVAEKANEQGLEPRREIIRLVKELHSTAIAKKPGFLFIAQNTAELTGEPELLTLLDGIAQEHIWFDGAGDPDDGGAEGDVAVAAEDSDYVTGLLEYWKSHGIPVFHAEYAEIPSNVSAAYSKGRAYGYCSYTCRRSLDRLTSTPPPGY